MTRKLNLPTSTTKKSFPASAILGVYTGIVINGFGEIRDVFDHLFPGIMEIGICSMATHAKEEMARQYPILRELPEFTPKNWQEMWKIWEPKLPKEFEIDGPLQVPRDEIDEAYDEFTSRIKRE